MRGLGAGKPFMLMESTSGQVNWQAYSPLKRPGQMFTQSLQAIAHGADTVQYFQLKQSIGAQEKFHGAVIAHSQRTDTRIFKEIQRLGQMLARLVQLLKIAKCKPRLPYFLIGKTCGPYNIWQVLDKILTMSKSFKLIIVIFMSKTSPLM